MKVNEHKWRLMKVDENKWTYTKVNERTINVDEGERT